MTTQEILAIALREAELDALPEDSGIFNEREGIRKILVGVDLEAPEVLVEEVITRLKALSGGSVRNLDGVPEKVTFPLPKELQDIR